MTYSAQYPNNIPYFTDINPRVDGSSIVSAIDVNSLYAETTKLAQAVGTNPFKRGDGAGWGIGTFDTTTVFTTLGDRVNNVENGTYVVYNDYVKRTGSSVIISSGTNVVNLALTAINSQIANMFEARNSSNTIVTKITAEGKLWTASIDGGSA